MKKLKPKIFHPQSKQLIIESKCYLGVSVANPYIMGDKIYQVLEWVEDRYPSCRILIGDYLHRINKYIFEGCDEADAKEKSLAIGQEIESRIRKVLGSKLSSKFEIIHWLDAMKQYPEYKAEEDSLKSYLVTNVTFKQSIEDISLAFINKRSHNNCLSIPAIDATKKSVDYLLEEMAIFAAFSRNGYCTHIYPGEILGTLKEIIRGDYPDLRSPLSDITYIQLTT